jgi:HPr kinase/phosphorylase
MANYKQLCSLCRQKIDFSWVYGIEQEQADLRLSESANNYPSLSVGFLNIIHPDRIHILGPAELNFLKFLTPADQEGLIAKLAEGGATALVVANGLKLPDVTLKAIQKAGVPFFSSTDQAELVVTAVRNAFVKILAPRCSMHGVFMDVFGLGVLLKGQSGIGKSELGLELITRGHGLIADDVVDFIQRAPDHIEGRAPELLANLLEVRGIGLLDIKTIFGEGAVRRKMRLHLIAELHQFNEGELMERLPETDLYEDVLGVQIKKMIIPVGGGRNLSVLVEAAVRSAILQMRGIDTIKEFFNRQRMLMEAEE